MNRLALSNEIMLFLSQHGVRDQWEGEDNGWKSKGAKTLEDISNQLKDVQSVLIKNELPLWESGGFAPFDDLKAKKWFESIIAEIQAIL
jgi:hypothetical protein